MEVVPVPVRSDNYAYLLIDQTSKSAAVVDPYDLDKVVAAADSHQVQITAALTTHHHHDHSGGNADFAAKFPDAPIYGGSDKVTALTNLVKDKSEFSLGSISIRCLATPCHTQDSICYYATNTEDPSQPGHVFTGDTLFIGGCGRFFEGTAAEMHHALSYLGTLPNNTIISNGHEYTKSNLAFARSIDPNSKGLERLSALVDQNSITTGLTTIGDEKEWNVFMTLDSSAVRDATRLSLDVPAHLIMQALRDAKNDFKG
ncbi:Metallo-hydrolase/oxidoreductase [Pluteus cervinus]|uniref:Metallo-hydrolase/oxidoreductase n=1 Tax=Pluteus cervinus TaxID=181527 RepID=A0ACD3ARN6_9AGAR|nr:Metallo-hydrolase/oxidoreductase [Pluteus cervinus]